MRKGSHHSEESKQKIRLGTLLNFHQPPIKRGAEHPLYGKHHTEETKRKMSEQRKGKKGRPWTEDSKQKLSLSKIGNKACVGRTYTEDTILKMKQAATGRKFSDKHRENLSKAKKGKYDGKDNPNYGKHLSADTKEKIGKSNIGKKRSPEIKLQMSDRQRGEKNWNWRGGRSSEPYPIEFNHELKESIRRRDQYQCQLCYSPQNGHRLHVHHIDYCKYNLNPNNLISLCIHCHMKTGKNREYYTEYFNYLLNHATIGIN